MGQVPVQLMHAFAGQYDECMAFAREHLETTQGTRKTANTGTHRIKEPEKNLQRSQGALWWFEALHSAVRAFA